MKNIVVTRHPNNSIELKNCQYIRNREFLKLKLFLRSFKNCKIEVGESSIVIFFEMYEKKVFTEYVVKIINYLNESSIKYEVDNQIEQNRDDFLKVKESLEYNKNRLQILKNNGFHDSTEYKEYCDFCNTYLSIKLRGYQYEASYLLSIGKGGFDFSVPGAGKTIITYATFNYLNKKEGIDYTLIIGPKNAYNAWFEEYITCFGTTPEFTNLSNVSLDKARNYLKASPDNQTKITFINIDKVRRLQDELVLYFQGRKSLLIIDEGHKVKNPNAKSTQVVMNVAPLCECKIILTGTPMPNGYDDLFSLAYIYSPLIPILPFTHSQLKGFTKNGATNIQEENIMKSIYPFYSRVSKKYLLQSGELEEPVFHIKRVEMSQEQRLIYDFLDGLITNFHNDWETNFSISMMKAILIRKMQVSANPALLNKSISKYIDDFKDSLFNFEEEQNYTTDLINEIKISLEEADKKIFNQVKSSKIGQIIQNFVNGKYPVNKNEVVYKEINELLQNKKKVVIWDSFVDNMLDLGQNIEKKLSVNVGIINGLIIGEEREKILEEFRFGELMVLIASPATLSESISLHKSCQNAIYVNRNYNAAQYIQSKDRIHRINMPIGLTANYIIIINNDSVDEAVNERLLLKEERMLRILDSDNLPIGDIESDLLSNDDVYFSYRK